MLVSEVNVSIIRYVPKNGENKEMAMDLFPQTLKTAKCAVLIYGISSSHVESCVLLCHTDP